jgi:hypothetical protein
MLLDLPLALTGASPGFDTGADLLPAVVFRVLRRDVGVVLSGDLNPAFSIEPAGRFDSEDERIRRRASRRAG